MGHCVYTTNSFKDATLKAANLRGDADTVCAVTGQIAGALYGASGIPQSWLDRVQRWDGGTILARALMLYDHEPVGHEVALSDAACTTTELLGTCWRPLPVQPRLGVDRDSWDEVRKTAAPDQSSDDD